MEHKWHEIQKLVLSGNVTSFEAAVKEGNYEIMVTLFNLGLVSCQLHNYEFNIFSHYLNLAISLAKYELKLSFGYQTLANFIKKDLLEDRVEFRNYTHPAINKIGSTKYNYKMQEDLQLKLGPSYVKADGRKYSESFNQITHNEFVYSVILIAPIFLVQDYWSTAKFTFSLIGIYNNFHEKFFLTSDDAINKIDGSDLIFQLFLFEKKNLDSLRFQNSKGQSPLHVAILSNDTEKAFKLLCCNSSLVEELIRIEDIAGELPLHYAAKNNNTKIAKILLDKGANINEESFNSLRSLFDGLFIVSKLLYLFTYFTDWVSSNDLNRPMLLWPMYFILKGYDIKIPENIYFHTLLLKLNPFGKEDNYLYEKSESYDGYSKDTVLHLASKKNYTDMAIFFIEQGAVVDGLNANGESALHFAVKNNNLELINILLKYNADINNQAKNWMLYPLADFALKSVLLCAGSDNLLRILSDGLFLKGSYDEVFSSFSRVKGITPLHYAVNNKEILELLINNAADADLTMTSYGNNLEMQILPYLLTKALVLLASTYQAKNIAIAYKLSVLLAFQTIYSLYFFESVKAIDLIELDSNRQCSNYEEYLTLKQYTILNDYRDVNNFNIFDTILYKLGLISDDDEIHINEFGTYKGGSGKDRFILHDNITGRVIIKDYTNEDQIICANCIRKSKLHVERFINENSTFISINENLELILLGVEITDENFIL